MTRKEGVVLKGTGGVWHVRTESGEIHEASLRGRLKQERDESKKLQTRLEKLETLSRDKQS